MEHLDPSGGREGMFLSLQNLHLPKMLPVRHATSLYGVPEGGIRLILTGSKYDTAELLENNAGLRGAMCGSGGEAYYPTL